MGGTSSIAAKGVASRFTTPVALAWGRAIATGNRGNDHAVFDLTLEHGHSVATLAAVAAAAVLLAALLYRRAFGSLRRQQWQLLLALRVAAILIVVLLLFRPVLSYYKTSKERLAVVFLVDRSASMSIADDPSGLTRFDQSRRQAERWWDALGSDCDLRIVSFAERAEPLRNLAQLAGESADGEATSLSRGLVAAARLLPQRDESAVVLLSDGIHNSAVRPVEIASRLGVVVHTVGVGASLRSDLSYRDVQVVGWDCPDRMRLGNIARLTASVEAVGLPGRVVRVTLEEDDQLIEEKELTLDEIEGPAGGAL